MSPALPNKNWYYVYLLESGKTSWIYIGCTSNLKKRLEEHNTGKVFSTRQKLPVELLYYEAFRSRNCAFQREKSLKAFGSGLAKLKVRLGIKSVPVANDKTKLFSEKGRAG